MHYRSDLKEFDLDTIRIELPPMGGAGSQGGGLNLPGSGLTLDGPPVFGAPPPSVAPAAPAGRRRTR